MPSHPNKTTLDQGCPEAGRQHLLIAEVDRLVCIYCARQRYIFGSWEGTASLMEQVWS